MRQPASRFGGKWREEGRALLGIIGGGPPSSSSGQNVAGQPEESPKGDVAWHQEVESLLKSLTGVISARVVSRPGGGVEEVHLLTTLEVTPKQAVRNVESALLAHFDLPVDHRKISVAQTTARPEERPDAQIAPSGPAKPEGPPVSARNSLGESSPRGKASSLGKASTRDRANSPVELSARAFDPFDEPVPPVPELPLDEQLPEPEPSALEAAVRRATTAAPPVIRRVESTPSPEGRILFVGHSIESLRSQRLNMKVALEWEGNRLMGEASGADLARSRLEGFAAATLDAVESAFGTAQAENGQDPLVLTLDGVQTVEAFDRQFILVAVTAQLGPKVTHLTGAAAVDDSRDRAVILATLQAIDRRVRAFLLGVTLDADAEATPANPDSADSADSENPFEVWA